MMNRILLIHYHILQDSFEVSNKTKSKDCSHGKYNYCLEYAFHKVALDS